MKIKHILVTHKHEAEDLLKKLDQGSSFEEIAQKYSQCSSSQTGGDLGDLSRKRHLLDSDFLDACDGLKIDQISKPVRTKFGYHLIKLYK